MVNMKDIITYLYLDDNDKVTRDGDIELFNATNKSINIITDYPKSWRQRINSMRETLADIDGLILDWEFTNRSSAAKEGSPEAEDVDFSAESLTEHIRVGVVNQSFKDIPIILCSADRNKAFTKVRTSELTSFSLFDLYFIKQDLFDKEVEIAGIQLHDLSIVYSILNADKKDLNKVLGISGKDNSWLDLRFMDKLSNLLHSKTTHDVVQFMLREFIEAEGLLIDEKVLAARLGVDIQKSGKHWNALLNTELKFLEYTGFLSKGWPRFWASHLESWWREQIKERELRVLGASFRVKCLNEKFKLELIPAEKIQYCSSDEFWTICYGTKRPLDPSNGFTIGDEPKFPWQSIHYVSGYAELENPNNDQWKINVLDRERFSKFKATISAFKK